MSNYSLSQPMPDAIQNEYHTAGRDKSLSKLIENIPSDMALTQITADCDKHGKQKWYASRRAIAAGEIGCQKCQADKDVRRAKITSQRETLLDQVKLPIEHKRADFSDWHLYGDEKVRARLIKIATFAKQYAIDYKQGLDRPCILLSGKTGTGKTKIACIIANEIIRHNFNPRMTVLFKRSSDIQNEFKELWDRNSNKSKAAFMNELASATVLIIDEVGEGDTGYTATTANKDRELLSAVIDRRYSLGLPTIITTNMTDDDFYNHIGDRATDRLRQRLVSIPCAWRSYRDSYSTIEVV